MTRSSSKSSDSLECYRWVLESGLHLLWLPLFNENMGLKKGGKGPLTRRLAEVLKAAKAAKSCSARACNTGFALSVALQLREAADSIPVLQQSLEVRCIALHLLLSNES